MQKNARKPSTDPAQEKLRQDKAAWNKEVSSFVNDLIHFKKMMNGWPSKFHMEKSFIKDPIPADPTTIIGSLAGDFQVITEKGNKIIQQQLEYSKTRKKRQMKQLNLPLGTPQAPSAPEAPAAPTPDLTQQLSLPMSGASYNYALVAEASNPITRFFTRMLTPTIGISEAARIRKYRMNLLASSAKTYKDLSKFEVQILKSGVESIRVSNEFFIKTWNDWILVARGFAAYKSNMPKIVPDVGGQIPTTNPVIPTNNPQGENPPEFNEEYENDQRLPNQDFQPNNQEQQVENLNEELVKKPELPKPPTVTIPTKLENASAQLEIVAQDFLKKWIGKTNHQLSMFDQTSSYRLDIYKMSVECRKLIDQIMNLLEKGMDIDSLTNLIVEVNKKMVALKGLMRALNLSNKVTPPPKAKKG